MKSVILTNNKGQSLGTAEIIAAHAKGGRLHKAFSVFIFTPDQKKLLIQKRSKEKSLWAGYWSNTCCSHPKEEKPIEVEAAARLEEECGFTCPLRVKSSFVYKARDPHGNGTEYEYDTILIGEIDETVQWKPNPAEIEEMQWMDLENLAMDIKIHPDMYTPWFVKGLKRILEK